MTEKRRKTKKVNGHYRKKKRKQPQFSTVEEMLAYTANKKREAIADDPRSAIGSALSIVQDPLKEIEEKVERFLDDQSS